MCPDSQVNTSPFRIKCNQLATQLCRNSSISVASGSWQHFGQGLYPRIAIVINNHNMLQAITLHPIHIQSTRISYTNADLFLSSCSRLLEIVAICIWIEIEVLEALTYLRFFI
jgi:hypothetical protein